MGNNASNETMYDTMANAASLFIITNIVTKQINHNNKASNGDMISY